MVPSCFTEQRMTPECRLKYRSPDARGSLGAMGKWRDKVTLDGALGVGRYLDWSLEVVG